MKKLLLALIVASIATQLSSYAMGPVILNGKVMQLKNVDSYKDIATDFLLKFAKQNKLLNSYDDGTLQISKLSIQPGNQIIAIYFPNQSRNTAIEPAMIIRKDVRAALDKNWLKEIDNKFKSLAQSDSKLKLHRRSGTPEAGEIIAVYRNPEAKTGNQLDFVQVRFVQ